MLIQTKAVKDASPADTLSRIRKALSILNLTPVETSNMLDPAGTSYSTRIELPGFPVGTNGKGVSPELAQASAYAEFMERLQNLALAFAPYIANPQTIVFPDQVSLAIDQIPDWCWQAISGSLDVRNELLTTPDSTHRACAVPYYDVFGNQVVHLPLDLLFYACGSNGMCAGNTPQEAVLQGMCEVLERHCVSRAYEQRLQVPTIPHNRLRGLHSYDMISKIQSQGMEVLVKDLSLGGRYPVIATYTFDSRTGLGRLCAGSHPYLDIALQRCITETFQGSDAPSQRVDWAFEPGMSQLHLAERMNFFVNGSGFFPSYLVLDDSDEGLPDGAFFGDANATNAELLSWVSRRLQASGARVFVRDVSFLGFPSYNVFIDTMSVVQPLDTPGAFLALNGARIRASISRLDDADVEALLSVQKGLRLIADPASGVRAFEDFLARRATAERQQTIDYHGLSAWTSLATKDYAQGVVDHSRYMQTFDTSRPDYLMHLALGLTLKMLAEGASDKTIQSCLQRYYGVPIALLLSKFTREPRAALRSLFVDNLLPLDPKCEQTVQTIVSALRDNALQQEDLANIFA